MPFIARVESLSRLKGQIANGKLVIGAGADADIWVKFIGVWWR